MRQLLFLYVSFLDKVTTELQLLIRSISLNASSVKIRGKLIPPLCPTNC